MIGQNGHRAVGMAKAGEAVWQLNEQLMCLVFGKQFIHIEEWIQGGSAVLGTSSKEGSESEGAGRRTGLGRGTGLGSQTQKPATVSHRTRNDAHTFAL